MKTIKLSILLAILSIGATALSMDNNNPRWAKPRPYSPSSHTASATIAPCPTSSEDTTTSDETTPTLNATSATLLQVTINTLDACLTSLNHHTFEYGKAPEQSTITQCLTHIQEIAHKHNTAITIEDKTLLVYVVSRNIPTDLLKKIVEENPTITLATINQALKAAKQQKEYWKEEKNKNNTMIQYHDNPEKARRYEKANPGRLKHGIFGSLHASINATENYRFLKALKKQREQSQERNNREQSQERNNCIIL